VVATDRNDLWRNNFIIFFSKFLEIPEITDSPLAALTTPEKSLPEELCRKEVSLTDTRLNEVLAQRCQGLSTTKIFQNFDIFGGILVVVWTLDPNFDKMKIIGKSPFLGHKTSILIK
jgi:hypothetical protein